MCAPLLPRGSDYLGVTWREGIDGEIGYFFLVVKKFITFVYYEIQRWRERTEGDTVKAQVMAKYRSETTPVWRDLYDVLKEGGFAKAREFMQSQGGIYKMTMHEKNSTNERGYP